MPEIPEPDSAERLDQAGSDDDALEQPPAASPARLLFIPLVLVMAGVLVWLFVRWPGRATVTAHDLVRDLGRPGRSHWQQAYALAELLRSPQRAELTRDPALAADLSELLARQMDAGPLDANRIKMRVFLCRALGEFSLPVVQPVLVRASRLERSAAEIAVRRSAVEALAAHAGHVHRPVADAAVIEALIATAREDDGHAAARAQRAELRASTAFALGVLGSESALDQLRQMLDDSQPNVRYNAAIGLARHGHAAAVPVLLEMLDPGNPESVATEASAGDRAWRQTTVLTNAIRAAQQWAERNPPAERRTLAAAIESLDHADVPVSVRSQARQTLAALAALPDEDR